MHARALHLAIAATLGALLLAALGCAGEIAYRCPALQQYSETQQLAALRELQGHAGQLPMVNEMLSDYNRLRNACRALTAPLALSR